MGRMGVRVARGVEISLQLTSAALPEPLSGRSLPEEDCLSRQFPSGAWFARRAPTGPAILQQTICGRAAAHFRRHYDRLFGGLFSNTVSLTGMLSWLKSTVSSSASALLEVETWDTAPDLSVYW